MMCEIFLNGYFQNPKRIYINIRLIKYNTLERVLDYIFLCILLTPNSEIYEQSIYSIQLDIPNRQLQIHI